MEVDNLKPIETPYVSDGGKDFSPCPERVKKKSSTQSRFCDETIALWGKQLLVAGGTSSSY